MKLFNRIALFAVAFILISGLMGPLIALAAATPSFGYAASYAILASTYTNTSAATTITGDVGFTTGPAQAPLGTHPNYGSGVPYATAGSDQASALAALASESCTFTFAAGAIDLSTDVTHGTVGVYTPGVYCSTGAVDIGGALNLSGSGTYLFRSVGALTSTVGAVVSLSGASACDVFWTPTQATTLAANTTFVGTVIDDAGITVGANTSWSGRALAFGGTVTTGDTSFITAPSCSSVGSSSASGTITVTKIVINDNGGTKTVADFPLFISGTPVVSGAVNTLSGGSRYAVYETADVNYVATFSGDCDVDGWLNLGTSENLFCTITNDDIGETEIDSLVPPIIDVVKVASPLALPDGPGAVTYRYTLTNIGTVPVTDLTMVDDSCSPVRFVSGDSNEDTVLDMSETWNYECSTTLIETHTNTVIATGWANGLSATDTAVATVVVGENVLEEEVILSEEDVDVVAVEPTSTVPGLPATGFAPAEPSQGWGLLVAGIFSISLSFYALRKK